MLISKGTINDVLGKMVDQEDGKKRGYNVPCHPLLKVRKSSTPVPDDRLDEASCFFLACLQACVRWWVGACLLFFLISLTCAVKRQLSYRHLFCFLHPEGLRNH